MPRKITPASKAAEIRRLLRREGSSEHAEGVRWFFKDEIKSHGWYTGDLRKLARHYRRSLEKEFGIGFLIKVADELFVGRILEEKVFAVLLLEKLTHRLDDSHFALFESWIDRISSWADHDGLVHYLIAPMIASCPKRARKVLVWANSSDRWHRRAACVALIQSARQRKLFPQVTRLTNVLIRDQDDMVQKGLGWLLRESAKADPERTVPCLLRIRDHAPRLVIRTACETLTPRLRLTVLGTNPTASHSKTPTSTWEKKSSIKARRRRIRSGRS
jgi:3-methyladenine DNA glycosylase AlkD